MKQIIILLIFLSLSTSCKKKEIYPIEETTLEVNDFIWKAMNNYYLWKNQITELSDNQFKNQEELNKYLSQFSQPENLFNSLLYQPNQIDKWSWIEKNYENLLKLFAGIHKTTGMHIGLVYENNSNYNIFAYVKYILPNSDAQNKNIHRGDIFRKINGIQMNLDNYKELLNNEKFNIELAQWNGNNLTDTGNIINLQKTEIDENPIFITKVFHFNQKNIGYLMYNGFTKNYNKELNKTFNYFQSENIEELIIDLRYNPGGSVRTMQYLASMITGQFTNEILFKYNWHPQLQNWMQEKYPNTLQQNFVNKMQDGTILNHLNLSNIYIITTNNTASASESLINCLRPYINVIQFGTRTHGKYTASITLFDSPDFSFNKINPNHKWALQPIVLKISNALGTTDFINGLQPDVYQQEDLHNLRKLGEINEPLIKSVLNYINGERKNNKYSNKERKEIYYIEQKHLDEMYVTFPLKNSFGNVKK